MRRKELKVFTFISFRIAIVNVIIWLISLLILSVTSGENLDSILRVFVILAFLGSVFAIPLSIVSMFSKEQLSKRILALLINFLPMILIGYALMTEIIDEFFGNAP
ncbi:2-acyl-glycerophospho-ethanolamine acyltransferase [Cytobacillus sp. FSL H8-0458]|uniref:2-acyl-glycerophospho-ethanolamine acyltransferase n=1 Tax=Cytobacillus sp. FSL H8-0458 TaxID=2975346 RepID=UPI0030F8158B